MGKRVRMAWLGVLVAAAVYSAYTMGADVTWGPLSNFATITAPGPPQRTLPFNALLVVRARTRRGWLVGTGVPGERSGRALACSVPLV